jgi:hypothetical protein
MQKFNLTCVPLFFDQFVSVIKMKIGFNVLCELYRLGPTIVSMYGEICHF